MDGTWNKGATPRVSWVAWCLPWTYIVLHCCKPKSYVRTYVQYIRCTVLYVGIVLYCMYEALVCSYVEYGTYIRTYCSVATVL